MLSTEEVLSDHEQRLRQLEASNLQHLKWAETIWNEQQRTTDRMERLLERHSTAIESMSRKFWMVIGGAMTVTGLSTILIWALSRR